MSRQTIKTRKKQTKRSNTYCESFEKRLNKILLEMENDPESLTTGAYNAIAQLGMRDAHRFFDSMRELIRIARGTPQEQYLHAIIQAGSDYGQKVQQAQFPLNGPEDGVRDQRWQEFNEIRRPYIYKIHNLWKRMASTVSDAHAAYHAAQDDNTIRPNETGNDVLRRQQTR